MNKYLDNGKNKRIKRIPVTPELLKLLDNECDLQNNTGKDEYIIAPELSRTTVKNIITKGFTHYKRVVGVDNRKCFKYLRKAYISRHRVEYGDNGLTSTISDYSNQSVVDKHYTAQIDTVRKSKDFQVFPEDECEDEN